MTYRRYGSSRAALPQRALSTKVLCGAALAVAVSLLGLTPALTSVSSAASRTGPTYSTNTTSYCKAGATPITFWGWVPGIYRMVDVFNQTHPSICVDYVTKVGWFGRVHPAAECLEGEFRCA